MAAKRIEKMTDDEITRLARNLAARAAHLAVIRLFKFGGAGGFFGHGGWGFTPARDQIAAAILEAWKELAKPKRKARAGK